MKIGDRVAHRIERIFIVEDDGNRRLKRRGTIVDAYRSIFGDGPFWWVQWDDDLRLAYRECHLILASEVHLEVI